MGSPAHALLERSLLVGIGATGPGLIKVRIVEGRIALTVRVALLFCSTLLGANEMTSVRRDGLLSIACVLFMFAALYLALR